MDALTDAQWAAYEKEGYLSLGKVADDAQLNALRDRIDKIMLGTADVDYDRMLMQLDTESGRYESLGPQTDGHKGPTLNYRKIEGLELDPLFRAWIQKPIFADACRRSYGRDVSFSVFRAMFVNKPAGHGTFLPWHQDRWTWLSKDPLLTVYLALDASDRSNGCVQVIPRSHGVLINPSQAAGFLTEDQTARECRPEDAVYLELEAGEVLLLHNWLLHSSDRNHSDRSRRAFSVCYMEADTYAGSPDETFPVVLPA
jgi:phytanoyl-CoA hydroxylase